MELLFESQPVLGLDLGEPEVVAPKLNRRSSLSFRFGGLDSVKQETVLAPPVPDIRIPEDHIVRTLLKSVEEVLGSELRSRCVLWGGFGYDPVALFGILLYALHLGERSSRRIEDLCRYDTRFWFLSGGTLPDHSTLSRFRRRLDEDEGLDGLFQRVVEGAKARRLVKGNTLYVDGTKIPTSGSQWRKYLNEAEAVDACQESPEPQEKAKRKFEEPWDKQARSMKTTHGEFIDGFNCQVGVDSEFGIVVGVLATTAANDSTAVGPLLEATKRLSDVAPKQVVGDKGYDGYQNHQAALGAKAETYFCPKERRNPPFKQDENGVFRCLAGHKASIGKTTKDGVPYIVYKVSQCAKCLLREACGKTSKGDQREMNVQSGDHAAINEANRERCQSGEGKELLRKRGQTVEFPFARIKQAFRMRRFYLAGLKGARIEMMFACIALNLQTIWRLS